MTALCCWRCVLTPDATERRNLQLKRERKRIHEEIEKGRAAVRMAGRVVRSWIYGYFL